MPFPIRVLSVFHPWLLLAAAISAVAMAAQADDAKPDPKMEFDPAHAEKMKEGRFEAASAEVLVKSCVECHGGTEVESGLDLATRKGCFAAGQAGVVTGKSRDSNMWRFIAHKEDPEMPDGAEKLPEDQIAAVAKWIDLVPLRLAAGSQPPRPRPLDEHRHQGGRPQLLVLQPLVPQSAGGEERRLGSQPDRRLRTREAGRKGLTPNGPRGKAYLIRRAYFDLIGLPPSRKKWKRSCNDKDPRPTCQAARQAARQSTLRRALGPPLARCRPLRRKPRL